MFTFFHSEALLPLFSIFLSSFSSVNWNELLNKLVIQTWDIFLLFNYLFELLHIFSARKPKFLLRFCYLNCLVTSGLTLYKNRTGVWSAPCLPPLGTVEDQSCSSLQQGLSTAAVVPSVAQTPPFYAAVLHLHLASVGSHMALAEGSFGSHRQLGAETDQHWEV